jgi:hypothetical protein
MNRGRERPASSLSRRRQTREPYDVVLIVCEDAKAAPGYFTALIRKLRLSTANIRICGKECGSAPISVVEYAIDEFNKTKDYDRVYCVFDKDQHETYEEALKKVKSTELSRKAKFVAITSVPCFEYWLLLHYSDSARPYGAGGRKSPCEELIGDLKRFIGDYEKGRDVFTETYSIIAEAIRNAERVEDNQRDGATDNPSTKIHLLVKYLMDLKKSTASASDL